MSKLLFSGALVAVWVSVSLWLAKKTVPEKAIGGASAATPAPSLLPTSPEGLKRHIARRRGRVVLVNFWATWCSGCVEEFPALVKLQRRYASRGLSVVWVSQDSQRANAQVKSLLKSQRVSVPTLIAANAPDQFLSRFNGRPTVVALPVTYLYDKRGRRVASVSQPHTLAQFERMVVPLL